MGFLGLECWGLGFRGQMPVTVFGTADIMRTPLLRLSPTVFEVGPLQEIVIVPMNPCGPDQRTLGVSPSKGTLLPLP